MLNITGRVAGKSGKYFCKTTRNIRKVNGYIEEMINGQKSNKSIHIRRRSKSSF